MYEIGGPDIFAYRELIQLLLERTGWRRMVVPVPFGVWDVIARLTAWLPNPPLTRDQVRLLKNDNIVAERALTLAHLGIRPVPVQEVLLDCIG